MIRPKLLRWQYATYAANHTDPINFCIHLLAVPIFWLGLALCVSALIGASLWVVPLGGLLMALSMGLQGVGHRREANRPEPFTGFADVISRIVAEQLITFPRYAWSKFTECLRRNQASRP